MTLVLRYAARSDVGLVRTGNEDSGYAGPTLLVVADGMGGHAAGELASAAAVATFASLTETWETARDGTDVVMAELVDGVATTTAELGRVVAAHPELHGMGTTLTALAWHEGHVTLAHVGDSRAYQLREGELTQLTIDHTYVQMLVDTGRITAEEALTHSRRNLIMRAIDGVTDVEPDLHSIDPRAGDRFLLCSDGLSGVVPAAEIASLLGTGDPTYAAGALVEKALENGAPDNVTVVVAQVVDVDAADAAALLTAQPVVVGAAGERRNREQLADLAFPDDAEPDPTAGSAATGATGAVTASSASARRHAAPRGGWVKPTLVVAVVVLALASITTGAVLWARSQYYVGVADGNVAIYQGLNASVLGRPLATPVAVSTIAVTSLPEYAQEQVANAMPANGFDGAQQVTAALACLTTPTSSGCTAPPSPTPTSSTTVTPSLGPPATTPGPSAPGSSP